MIEKYLNDSISGKDRHARVDQLSKLNLIPPRIYAEMRRQDSMRHSKDSAYLIEKGYITILRDTLDLDEAEEQDALDKLKKDKEATKNKKKDSTDGKVQIRTEAILPDQKKRPEPTDSSDEPE